MRSEAGRLGGGIGALAVLSLAALSAVPAAAQVPPLPGTSVPASSPSDGIPLGDDIGSGEAAGVSEGGSAAPWAEAGPVRLGTLGFPYTALATPDASTRGWSFTPSLGLELEATDNLYATRRNRKADFITRLQPGLLFTVDTARLQGVFNYQPELELHAAQGSQNGIDHFLNGQLLLTVVPNAVYVDLRGSAGVQAAGGGYAPTVGETGSRRENDVQTSSFQISPYVVHRFGGTATVQAGYALQHVSQSLQDGADVAVTPTGQRYFSNQDFTAHEFYGTVRSGEDFGRLALEGQAVATEYDGTGVLDNAYRRNVSVESRFAINRFFSVLGEVGYEWLRYSGFPPFQVSDTIWSGGARLTFSDESFITARYGHRDGFDSARVDAALTLGGRTRFYANYAERLTTGAQRAADLLTTTTLDELGNPVDTATGAPLAQPFSNSFLGVQSSLTRLRTASASISQDWGRDTFILTVSYERQRPIATEFGTVPTRQSGTSGSLTWAHDLTPFTSAVSYVQYGTLKTPARGSGDVFTASLALVTQLRPGLAATLQYMLTNRSDDFSGGRATQNVILAGLRQTF
ncbi:TIGR03016 family PEP-CTERM system-associated outer membrane protein [Teichococcus wenyumeiae]|nr:TIGR03016 family PEP-CTERM system-associated outer membrane protein [Pseudoroseomonas wenyumeiae]